MNKKSFGWLMFFLTFLLSGISVLGIIIAAKGAYGFGITMWQRVLWAAVFFSVPMVFGLIGATVAEAVREKNHVLRRCGSRLLSFALAIAAAGLLGGVSQYLYMKDWSVKKETNVEKSADIVLLIDCSTSMTECMDACRKAARGLVEEIDSDCAVQVIAFSTEIVGSTELLPLYGDGRRQVAEYIDGLDVVGATNFIDPLDMAMDTLTQSATGNATQTVILLTDGVGDLSREVKKRYLEAEIPVYSVSILEGEHVRYKDFAVQMRKDMTRFVQKSGGFDTVVYKDTVGNADLGSLADALKQAYHSTVLSVGSSRAMVFFGMTDFNLFRAILRLITLLAYAFLTTFIYFRRMMKSMLISVPVTAVVSFALICLFGRLSPSIGLSVSAVVFVLGYWTVFAVFRTVQPRADAARKR